MHSTHTTCTTHNTAHGPAHTCLHYMVSHRITRHGITLHIIKAHCMNHTHEVHYAHCMHHARYEGTYERACMHGYMHACMHARMQTHLCVHTKMYYTASRCKWHRHIHRQATVPGCNLIRTIQHTPVRFGQSHVSTTIRRLGLSCPDCSSNPGNPWPTQGNPHSPVARGYPVRLGCQRLSLMAGNEMIRATCGVM